MRHDKIDFIGYVAAISTTLSFLPQLIRVVRLRSSREISLGMFLIFSVGTALWLTYGLLSHSEPVTVVNAVKLRFDRNVMKEVTGV